METQNIYCKNNIDCGNCTFLEEAEIKNDRKVIFEILYRVNEIMKKPVGKYPSFVPSYVGSSKRALTFVQGADDTEFDHDLQILYSKVINPIKSFYEELRYDFIGAVNKSWPKDEFDWKIENATRSLMITKSLDGKLLASFDVALIDGVNNKIHVLDKKNYNEPKWYELGKINAAYERANTLDEESLKQNYLNLKHKYKNIDKADNEYKSPSKLFIEAVNNTSKKSAKYIDKQKSLRNHKKSTWK